MTNAEFVDYYELLEVSFNANTDTIERVFRYLARRYHPDVAETGDNERFSMLVDACKTLTCPELRARYDQEYQKNRKDRAILAEGVKSTDADCGDRHVILSLFYAARRRDMKNPGVGAMQLEQLLGCPSEVLEFHLWFLREKNWIRREENGLFAITADGVDEIEARCLPWASKDRRIAHQSGQTAPPSSPGNNGLVEHACSG